MKKHIIFYSLLLTIASACSDQFIEQAQTPYNQIVAANFYKTPPEAFEALVPVYHVLQYDGFGNIYLTSEISSDNCFAGSGLSDNAQPLDWDGFISFNDQNINAWAKYYRGIYLANLLLSKLDGVDWGTSNLQKQYTAEARFLRAYFYFDLVRMFGNVPLITQPLTAGNYYIPQASPDSVYHQIAVDLKYAIDNLPATPRGSIASTDYGRVTKWAAEGLMARVFLFYTNYHSKSDLVGVVSNTQAIAYIDDIVTNGGFSLISDYTTLWRGASIASSKTYVGEDNSETVWSIKFTSKGLGNFNTQTGNLWQVYLGMRGGVAVGPYDWGWGFCTVNPAFYSSFDAADTRRDASIISFTDEGLTYTGLNDQRQYTGYMVKKYVPTAGTVEALGGNEQVDNFDDYLVLRYSDILLMGAELNLNTDLPKAQNYFDQVRLRAFNNDASHNITLASGQAGLANIMQERNFELAFEGLRYWDLIRQGMTVASQAINNTDANPQFNVTFPTATGGLLQIPQSQINISNGTIKQNNGW